MAETASTITSYLTADHRGLDAILEEAVHRAQAGDLEGAAARFRLFRSGLDRHIDVEEQLLFPMFEERSGVRSGPTTVMRSEHAEIREAMQLVSAHLSAGAIEPALAEAARLASVLGGHNAKEERVLYPMSDRLAVGDLPELLRRMAEYQQTPETASAR